MYISGAFSFAQHIHFSYLITKILVCQPSQNLISVSSAQPDHPHQLEIHFLSFSSTQFFCLQKDIQGSCLAHLVYFLSLSVIVMSFFPTFKLVIRCFLFIFVLSNIYNEKICLYQLLYHGWKKFRFHFQKSLNFP